MTIFQPAPTYADPVIIDASKQPGDPGYSKFSPEWLHWFLNLIAIINASGGGGGTIQHNMLAGLQGGTANEFYHFSNAQHTNLLALNTAEAALVALAAVNTQLQALAAVTPIAATITTAKLTAGGTNGSMTFVNGLLTAQTPAT